MSKPDTCITLVPYFKVHEGQMASFKQGCDLKEPLGGMNPQWFTIEMGLRR